MKNQGEKIVETCEQNEIFSVAIEVPDNRRNFFAGFVEELRLIIKTKEPKSLRIIRFASRNIDDTKNIVSQVTN